MLAASRNVAVPEHRSNQWTLGTLNVVRSVASTDRTDCSFLSIAEQPPTIEPSWPEVYTPSSSRRLDLVPENRLAKKGK